jgi:hypothetical protein
MGFYRRWSVLLAGSATIFAAAFGSSLAGDVESPKDDIAAQVRAQGYACDQPQEALKDESASRPDEAVWLLRCADASYRVRLIPDMAARIEPVEP